MSAPGAHARRWVIPRWLAALLSPTPGCACATCRDLRANYVRLDHLVRIAPRAARRKVSP
jgi:hypothetical protein